MKNFFELLLMLALIVPISGAITFFFWAIIINIFEVSSNVLSTILLILLFFWVSKGVYELLFKR